MQRGNGAARNGSNADQAGQNERPSSDVLRCQKFDTPRQCKKRAGYDNQSTFASLKPKLAPVCWIIMNMADPTVVLFTRIAMFVIGLQR